MIGWDLTRYLAETSLRLLSSKKIFLWIAVLIGPTRRRDFYRLTKVFFFFLITVLIGPTRGERYLNRCLIIPYSCLHFTSVKSLFSLAFRYESVF
jgi:hypothetical protein